MKPEESKALSEESTNPAVSAAAAPARNGAAQKPVPEDAMILIPMRNTVLFPGVISPITVGRPGSVAAAQEAVKSERKIGFVLQREAHKDHVKAEDLYWVGTSGQVVRYITGAEGTHHLVVQGQARFRALEFLEGWPFLVARVQAIEANDELTQDIEARFLQLKAQSVEALSLLPNAPEELGIVLQGVTSPGMLADMVANLLDVKHEEKQDLLETFDLKRRMDKVIELLGERVGVLRISKEIGEKTRKQFDERQREHVLREQMRQIQKELGEGDEGSGEIEELRKAIDEAGMPEDTHKHALKELRRLERMGEGSAEGSMLRTYLEWLSEIPWRHEENAKAIDIQEARRVLDEDHFGLDKIKRRILEHLAVRKLNPEGKSPILCFVGPPGVGKTSLGQSIARATGRRFQRIALGGVHDEAEIRGHRRTYIGALPGNVIQAIRRAESKNTVLMFDEIDKLGQGGFHGDPSSALLEVLDPEQNARFRDNYLAVDYDLSKVMFITTANMLDTIPGPLRDRMEIVALPGYTEEEKVEIARRYLIKRQLEANGLKSADPAVEDVTISEAALRSIIADYTREAGVRNLEREIGSVLRHVAMRIAEQGVMKVQIKPEDLHAILGPTKYENEVAQRTTVPGVATGLAWTSVGGDILFIEASKVPGSGKLILTGQLGDVMKESAQAALTLSKLFTLENLEKFDIHVHVPAGATPKDGPSAGVAMFTALVSLLSGKPVRSDVAMTGEISLRGLVLPIGGVKEKTLAALRAGIKTVMLPKRNEKDLEDVPKEAREKLEFVFLEKVEDAVRAALEVDPDTLRQRERRAA
jgi:ATP-dependent Lon protease